MTPGEQVLVVPRECLFDGAPLPQGFGRTGLDGLFARIGRHGRFVPREAAERDPALQQIIPYMIVQRGERVLGVVRRRKQSESRLHDLFSIGIGGHINPVDAQDPLQAGMERELHEELQIAGGYRREAAGYVNDDTNEVGAVHFGLVYRVQVEGEVAIRETEGMAGRLHDLSELAAAYARMESWSQMVFDALLRGATA